MMGSIFKKNCIVSIAFLPKSYQLFLDVLLNFTNVKDSAWVELSLNLKLRARASTFSIFKRLNSDFFKSQEAAKFLPLDF